MKRTTTVLVAGLVVLSAATAGCGPHSKVKADLASASANPAVVAEKAKIEGCVSAHLAAGHQAVINCIVPAGSGPADEQCVTAALNTDGVLTKAARDKFYQDAANCAVSPTPAASASK